MTAPTVATIDAAEVRAFLAANFDPASADVAFVGQGGWSRCFGFTRGADDLVVRVGLHVDDFYNDQRASAYRSPELPIPEVLAIGTAFDGYYAISTRVRGEPIEQMSAEQWRATAPSLAAALERLRTADLSATTGYGGWGRDGNANRASWRSHLLAVGDDTPAHRTHGWRKRLAASSVGEAAFVHYYDLLCRTVVDVAPRSLIHGDLVNRNALAAGGKVTGIFDWGCSIYGDHLYDLAWLAFFAPWCPGMDLTQITAELEQRWRAAGYAPEHKEQRMLACMLYIGLDSIAYNAHISDWPAAVQMEERMRALV